MDIFACLEVKFHIPKFRSGSTAPGPASAWSLGEEMLAWLVLTRPGQGDRCGQGPAEGPGGVRHDPA